MLSILRRRHSSLVWSLAMMATEKRTVFSQGSLADTCKCALSSVLVIDMNWIAAWTPHQLARLARLTSEVPIFFRHGKLVQCVAHSCWELEQATRILIKTGFLEAITQQHQQLRLFPTQGLTCLPDSSFLRFQHSDGDTLRWSDLWPWWKLRTWHLHECPFFTTRLLHERAIYLQELQDIDLAQVIHLLILGTGTGNMIPGNNRIPGSHHTAASAEVWFFAIFMACFIRALSSVLVIDMN